MGRRHEQGLRAAGAALRARALALLAGATLGLICASATARANDSGFSAVAREVRTLGPESSAARVADVLRVLDASDDALRGSVSGRYLRARLLERAGQLADAVESLPDASGLPERVVSDIRSRRAQWLARLGRCSEAMPLLREVLEGGDGRLAHALALGRCALQTGDAAQAVSVLERVTRKAARDAHAAARLPRARRRLQAELLVEHGRALRIAGRTREAQALLEQAWLVFPAEAAADDARRELDALAAQRATLVHKLLRAEAWLELHRAKEALDELKNTTAPKERSLRARYLHVRGMALFGMRTRYAEAATVLARAAALPSDTAESDAFHAARALARADHDGQAIRALRAFAKARAGSPRASEALQIAGWLELRLGRASGVKALHAWLATPGAAQHPELAKNTLFELGMDALEHGKAKDAAALFSRYTSASNGALDEGRGLYWGARALLRDDRAGALELLKQAAVVEPLHWYALLARQQLIALGEALPPVYAAAEASPDAATAYRAALRETPVAVRLPDDVTFYAALGLYDDAVAALREQEATVKASAPAGRALEALVAAYHALAEHARARVLVHDAPLGLLTSPPSASNAWALRAAYARPHPDDVSKYCEREGIDPDLVYAVMLKESAFAPDVVSSADAIGLMQLLPATADKVAAGLGTSSSREQLFQPHHNLELGIRLLAQLVKRYDGQAQLAVAAYNAGSHRVDAWLERARAKAAASKEPIALDQFVEEIPIEQTRNYVRRVTTFWARYRYLGAEASVLEVPGVVALPAAASSARRLR